MLGPCKENIKIGVSSACFMTDEIGEMVAWSREIGIRTIELGSNVKHGGRKEIVGSLRNYQGVEFLIHHYFPPPEIPFVCNIGHPATVERACDFIKKNIEMCSFLGISYYSLHAGYGINPSPDQLGERQSSLKPIPYEKSIRLFVDTAARLEAYGKSRGVKLVWENNVVSAMNLFDTKRTPYLFADVDFLIEVENERWWKSALVLLDMGHVKVSAATLNYAPAEFVERIAEKVIQIHLSDNDGMADTNQPVTNETFRRFKKLSAFVNLETVILEVYRIGLPKIREQVDLIREHIGD